jgi:hypothetical protein
VASVSDCVQGDLALLGTHTAESSAHGTGQTVVYVRSSRECHYDMQAVLEAQQPDGTWSPVPSEPASSDARSNNGTPVTVLGPSEPEGEYRISWHYSATAVASGGPPTCASRPLRLRVNGKRKLTPYRH